MKLIDLTHTFTRQMPLYPGDPTPEFAHTATIQKDGHNAFTIKTHMHVGTHIDAPFHMLEGGKLLSSFPVEHFFGRGCLLDARGKEKIDIELLEGKVIDHESIVLIFTGHDKKFGQPAYYETYPEISEALAQKFIDAGVKIVGMDTPSPDQPPFTIHKMLLGNDILLLENLTHLEKLLGVEKFDIMAFPPKLEADGSPVRVVAKH